MYNDSHDDNILAMYGITDTMISEAARVNDHSADAALGFPDGIPCAVFAIITERVNQIRFRRSTHGSAK